MVDSISREKLTGILKTLKLSEQEGFVYITLNKTGKTSVFNLSQKCKIPRTTTYRICKSLNEKGFCREVFEDTRQIFEAVSPRDLDHLITSQEEAILSQRQAIKTLQDLIPAIPPSIPQTQMKFYHGKEGLKQVMWNSLSAKKEILGSTLYNRQEIVGKIFMNKWLEEFKRRRLRDRTIINEDGIKYIKANFHKPERSNYQSNEDIRFYPKSKLSIFGDIAIYNDTYAVEFWKDGEIIAFEISNPGFVKHQKEVFEILWKNGTKISKTFRLEDKI